MWFLVALVVLIALGLACAWWVDRGAAKRGYRIHVKHNGFRREVTYTTLDGKPYDPSQRRPSTGSGG